MRFNAMLAVFLALAPIPAGAQVINDSHILPVVAHTPGAGDPPTAWVSDVIIHNPTAFTQTVGLALYRFGQANPIDADWFLVEVAARQTRTYEDVLAEVFGVTDAALGLLVISCNSPGIPQNPEDCSLLVTSRTYNTGSPDGTFGQTVPSSLLSFNFTGQPSFVTGVRNDSRFRSNLGIVNGSEEAITIFYRVLDSDGGIIIANSVELLAVSGNQWSLASLGVGMVNDTLTIELWMDPDDVTPDACNAEENNQFLAYVSKVDGNPNGTGDAEFIPAMPAFTLLDCD